MKTPNKTLIGLATAAAIVGPMMPKTVTINITEPIPHTTKLETCSRAYTLITENGKKVCEYHCNDNVIFKVTNNDCDKTIKSR
jgi:hypothetical protein